MYTDTVSELLSAVIPGYDGFPATRTATKQRSWIDFDIFEVGEPRHDLGVVPDVPGLYFVGLHFLHTPSSGMFCHLR